MADTVFGGAALATELTDDAEQRRRGVSVTAGVAGTLTALFYNVPSNGIPSNVAMLYVANDANAIVCEVDISAAIPGATPGWNRIDASFFELAGEPTGPIDWPASIRYRVWAATLGGGSPFGRFRFTDPGTYPKVSVPDELLTADHGLYGGGAVPPATIPGVFDAYWDVDVEFTAAGPNDGTAALAVTFALAATGNTAHQGTMAQAVSFALAATGSAGGGTPGALSASETSAQLTASGSSPHLTPSGSGATLTASGTP